MHSSQIPGKYWPSHIFLVLTGLLLVACTSSVTPTAAPSPVPTHTQIPPTRTSTQSPTQTETLVPSSSAITTQPPQPTNTPTLNQRLPGVWEGLIYSPAQPAQEKVFEIRTDCKSSELCLDVLKSTDQRFTAAPLDPAAANPGVCFSVYTPPNNRLEYSACFEPLPGGQWKYSGYHLQGSESGVLQALDASLADALKQGVERPCAMNLPPRLEAGQDGRVTISNGKPVRVHSAPGASTPVENLLTEASQFQVINGPVCQDGFRWYFVSASRGIVGWIAEGDSREYYLEPWPPTPVLPTPTALTISEALTADLGVDSPLVLTYNPASWQASARFPDQADSARQLNHLQFPKCILWDNLGHGAPEYWSMNKQNRLIGTRIYQVETWTDTQTNTPVLQVYDYKGERIELQIGGDAGTCIQDAEIVLVLSESTIPLTRSAFSQ